MPDNRRSVLFRLGSDPAAWLWSGVGDLELPANSIDDVPRVYRGAGTLLNVPDLQQLINGAAERIDVVVSGVTPAMVQLALEDAPSVKGAQVDIGAVYFDRHWQLDRVEWIGRLRADTLTVGGASAANGRTRSVTLSIGTDFTDRSTAPIAFYTPADQARRSPTDRIFDNVPGYAQGTSRKFGPSDG